MKDLYLRVKVKPDSINPDFEFKGHDIYSTYYLSISQVHLLIYLGNFWRNF